MQKYDIYKACEEYFEPKKKIVDSVYSLVLNLLGSIKDTNTNIGDITTDLKKIEFFLLLVDRINKMPTKLGSSQKDNTYFGLKVEEIQRLFDMIINKRTPKKTEIVGFDIKTLEFDDVVAIFSTISRMAYVQFNNNVNKNYMKNLKEEKEQKKPTKDEKENLHIDDWLLSCYLNDEDIAKRVYAANRYIALNSVNPEKCNKNDLKKARLIIEKKGDSNDK